MEWPGGERRVGGARPHHDGGALGEAEIVELLRGGESLRKGRSQSEKGRKGDREGRERQPRAFTGLCTRSRKKPPEEE